MNKQTLFLLAAVILASASLFVAIPIIGTTLKGNQLAVATFAIMFNSIIGVFDVIRPAVTKTLSVPDARLSIKWLMRIASIWGVAMSVISYVGLNLASFPFLDEIDIAAFSLCIFVFCNISALWGVFDSRDLVGTAQLYRSGFTSIFAVLILLPTLIGNSSEPALALLASLTTLAIAMLLHLQFAKLLYKETTRPIRTGEFFLLLIQNLAKLPIDFGDRFVAAKLLSPAVYSLYGLIYEFVSKVCIFPQLASAYLYPKLCSNQVSPSQFLLYGCIFSGMLTSLAWLIYCSLDAISLLLFGDAATHSWLAPALLCYFASHSLSFFGQSIGRATGLHTELAISFGISAALGLFVLPISINLMGSTPYSLAISIAAFKSSYVYFSVFLLKKKSDKVTWLSLMLSLVSLISGVLITFLSFYDSALT